MALSLMNKPVVPKPALVRTELARTVYRTYEDYPSEDLFTYAGLDCIVTSNLLKKLGPSCELEPAYIRVNGKERFQERAMSIFESYDLYTAPAFEFIVDLELNGIAYDVAANKAMGEKMLVEVAELETEIRKYVDEGVNLDSGDDMVQLLYTTHGFEVPFQTKSGEPSTDGEALNMLAESTGLPWLKLVAKRKDIISVYRTFVQNYVQDFVKKDGRIHSSYNLHGTSSFRISGEDPNFTQIPRPKWGYNIRTLFIPSKGYVFVALDFSSAEVKILGAISRDPMLLKAIEENLDFHSFSASRMYKIPYEEFIHVLEDKTHPKHKEYKALRQRSKVLTFSILRLLRL